MQQQIHQRINPKARVPERRNEKGRGRGRGRPANAGGKKVRTRAGEEPVSAAPAGEIGPQRPGIIRTHIPVTGTGASIVGGPIPIDTLFCSGDEAICSGDGPFCASVDSFCSMDGPFCPDDDPFIPIARAKRVIADPRRCIAAPFCFNNDPFGCIYTEKR